MLAHPVPEYKEFNSVNQTKIGVQAINLVELGIADYREPDRDRAVFFGSVYVGVPFADPEVPSNQKLVYNLNESGSEIPISQPLTTGAGGFVMIDGTPARIGVEGDYSLKVLDKNGVQVYYIPSVVGSGVLIGNLGVYSIDLLDGQTEVIFPAGVPVEQGSVYIEGYNADNGRLTLDDNYTLDLGNNAVNLVDSYPAGTTITIAFYDASAAGGNSIVRTIAALKGLEPGVGATAYVLNYYEPDGVYTGGGGGNFYWDAASTEPDNGGTIIEPTVGGTGRWLRSVVGAIDVRQFGAKGDGVQEDTVFIQTAINYSASQELYKLRVPSGHYMINTLYFYYDAAFNPGYPNNVHASGRMSFEGDQSSDFASDVFDDQRYATIFEYLGATGAAMVTGDGVVNSVRMDMKNFGLIGTTTDILLHLKNSPQISNYENLYVRNDGVDGVAIGATDGMFTCSFRNIYATCYGGSGNNIAFWHQSGSLNHFDNITASYAEYGLLFGDPFANQGFGTTNVITNCQARRCNRNCTFYGGLANVANGLYLEQSQGLYDLKLHGNARSYELNGLLLTSTELTQACIVLGDDTGDTDNDACGAITISGPDFNFVGGAGIYGILKNKNVRTITVNNPSFKNNGGVAIGIDASGAEYYPIIINHPDWFPPGATSEIGVGSRVREINAPGSNQNYYAIVNEESDPYAAVLTGNTSVSISNAVNNGSGLIRITATGHGMTTGDWVHIEDVDGTVEANGEWKVTVIDANTYDLDGSTFTNAYVSGGFGIEYLLDLEHWKFIPPVLYFQTTGGASAFVRLPDAASLGSTIALYKQFASNKVGVSSNQPIDGLDVVIQSAVGSTVLMQAGTGRKSILANS